MSNPGNKDADNSPEGLIFPCEYPVKAMGLATAGMQEILEWAICEVVGKENTGALRERPSTNGRFISVTITANVDSRQQLEGIYQLLRDHDDVLMTL